MRDHETRDLHDVVVEQVANMLTTKYPGWCVYTNPGMERDISVDGTWPDLVLVDGAGVVRSVYEVESEDTVDLARAISSWSVTGNLGKPFYVVVPNERGNIARRLLLQLKLSARAMLLY